MVDLEEEVRALVEADKARKRVRQRYSAKVRERVVDYARAQRAKGASWKSIGRQIGVSSTTVRRYLIQAGNSDAGNDETDTGGEVRAPEDAAVCAPVAPVPVTVSLGPAAREFMPLVLVSPAGFRLEGLDLDGAAQLLGYLG